ELVVGVRNMASGDLVPLAGPGARVPVLADPVGERKIRGVASEGMLCSPRELGISADHGGILILPPDAGVGADFKRTFGLDDAVLEIGQPLHPFDLATLGGKGIVVRRAAEGELVVTLDDVERALTAEDLVIADREKAVAVAGVIGTAPTEVGPGTGDVLLES